jgi:hypothetical protein
MMIIHKSVKDNVLNDRKHWPGQIDYVVATRARPVGIAGDF